MLRPFSLPEIYQRFRSCPRINTDSRSIQEGDFFVALKGDRFDGNQYAIQALERGAAYALVSDELLPPNDQLMLVEDTLKSLQALATHHRQQFSFPVIALTGSNGKTTTKELIHQTLATTYRTHCTAGNLNNHIGVPLTLLRIPMDAEVAVIEMGANHQGEIQELCQIAEPTHGLITNIGKAHLEGFGGIEGVKRGKTEMYRYLQKTGGVIFLNRDMDHLQDWLPSDAKVIYYGTDNFDDLVTQVRIEQTEPYVRAAWKSDEGDAYSATAHIGGIYNFQNIKTAIAIGQYFKVQDADIQKAIEAYVPQNNRSQVVKQGNITFHLDAYNANPTSMAAALQYFNAIEADQKMVILGDMLELGDEATVEHQRIVDLVTTLNIDYILLVGKHFQNSTANTDRVVMFGQVDEAAAWVWQQTFQGIHVLLKGSRKLSLEQVPILLSKYKWKSNK